MGKFAGQLVQGAIKGVTVTYSGSPTNHKVAAITMSLTKGLLTPVLGETVNTINAINMMKDRGINLQEVISNQVQEYVNCIAIDIVTDKETLSVLGTLTSNNQPRIVKINNVYVEANPSGHILFILNNDQPGIVGAVGMVLGSESINIASITFGREKQGGLAMSVVNVDSEISETVVEKLRKTKNILFVKTIKV